MPFDTSMYQNFKGGTGLAALGQGLTHGLEIANQRKAQEQQAKQLAMQEEAAQRQKAAFETEQIARANEIRNTIGSQFGDWGGKFLSIKDPNERDAAWNAKVAELESMGVPRQYLPSSAQAAMPFVQFHSTKYQQAQQDGALDRRYKEAQIAKAIAESKKAGGSIPKGYKVQFNPETGEREMVPDTKTLPAETAAKLGNLLGAVEASGGIENISGQQPTGKLEAAWDWTKELFGQQDQSRARFSSDIANQRNQVMSRIAGANVTPDEKSRILEGIPTRVDAPDQFRAKAQSTTDGILRNAETEIAALEAAGYDTGRLKKQLQMAKERIGMTRRDQQIAGGKGASGSWGVESANAAAPQTFKTKDIEWAD